MAVARPGPGTWVAATRRRRRRRRRAVGAAGAAGVSVGAFIGPPGGWSRVGATVPTAPARWRAGTRGRRARDRRFGSRTLWYVRRTTPLRVDVAASASSSVLGDVVLDPRAPCLAPFVGLLGPGASWTRASARFRPTLALVVDRERLATERRAETGHVRTAGRPRRRHVEAARRRHRRERAAARHRASPLGPVPLSGGSTAASSWPSLVPERREAAGRDLDDAALAARPVLRRLRRTPRRATLRGRARVPDARRHAAEPGREALDAFVAASEGRTDEFAGYVDGLAVSGAGSSPPASTASSAATSRSAPPRYRVGCPSRSSRGGGTTRRRLSRRPLVRRARPRGPAAPGLSRAVGRARTCVEAYCDGVDQLASTTGRPAPTSARSKGRLSRSPIRCFHVP